MTFEPRYRSVSRLSEQQVLQLHLLYQGEWWTRGRSLDGVRRMLENSDYLFGVCREPGDGLVGFARVLTDRVYKALVFDVIVAPECRHEGLGRHLMERIVRHPDLMMVPHIELYCLPELAPFYEQWGFSTDVAGLILMRRLWDQG